MHTSRVILTIVQGTNKGANFIYDEPAQCLIGRASDCDIRLPTDRINGKASRYHCMFIIDPPRLRVLDLGSLNGTYVNEHLIGKRSTRKPTDTALVTMSQDRDLKDGDEVRVGHLVFRIGVTIAEGDSSENPRPHRLNSYSL